MDEDRGTEMKTVIAESEFPHGCFGGRGEDPEGLRCDDFVSLGIKTSPHHAIGLGIPDCNARDRHVFVDGVLRIKLDVKVIRLDIDDGSDAVGCSLLINGQAFDCYVLAVLE